MPRKHLIASQTNKKQQSQAKMWQKLAREIRAAVKVGGPNPEANPRLKQAVQKALANNLSRDSINKNINGSNVDKESLETLEYEAYGPNGLQIIINCLTDNPNRAAGNIRGYLSKLNGKLARPNAVKTFFDNKGHIIVVKTNNVSVDFLMEITMAYNILDILEQEDCFEIYTAPSDFYQVLEELKKNNVQIFSQDLKLFPQQTVNTVEDKEKYDRFISSCEDDDDVQWVVTNYVEE